MSDFSPREPWPGYADLDEAARDELLAKKFQQAKDQNDQDYALALAAAVANYEIVLEIPPLRRGPRRSQTTGAPSTPTRTAPPPSRSPPARAASTTTPGRGRPVSSDP